MLELVVRSVARAGGIDVPDDVRIFENPPARRSILKRLSQAIERWNARRSTYLTLKQMDGRMLKDIGLDRGMLHDIAGKVGGYAAANDNALPVALSNRAANDNKPPAKASCG